jgi:two-component system, NtrC family, response regulator AtoC
MKKSILIIDDEPEFNIKLGMGMPGFEFHEALSAKDGLSRLQGSPYDLILLDLNLNPSTEKLEGLDLIQGIKKDHPDIPLVVVTADEKTETVVTAMKLGADDFLRKSTFDLLSWKKKFELLLENTSLTQQVVTLSKDKYEFAGNSPKIQKIKSNLKELAANPDVTVLITGETGTGKEIAARYFHQNSTRRKKIFVPVNLTAIQENLLESELFGHKKGAFTGAHANRTGFFRKSDGGILFLDEIGDLSLASQAKLLRFFEEKTIHAVGDEKEVQLDVQVLAATNRDLKKMVEQNRFREDLYYRIKTFNVDLPPLRERREDIPVLIKHFLNIRENTSLNSVIADEALEVLKGYKWPGNVRELKNTIDFAFIKSRKQKIEPAHLPLDPPDFSDTKRVSEKKEFTLPLDLERTMDQFQLNVIETALAQAAGNKGRAAETLNLNRDGLRNRIVRKRSLSVIKEQPETYPHILKYYKKEIIRELKKNTNSENHPLL